MPGFDHCQVVTTTDSREAADRLAHTAVTARLAGCAQVDGPVTSRYWWDGEVQTAQEWRVVFKTTAARYQDLERHIRENHGYDVPEILCTPVVAGNPDYLAWLSTETSAAT